MTKLGNSLMYEHGRVAVFFISKCCYTKDNEKIKDTGKKLPKVRDTGKKKQTLDPEEIGRRLGADFYINKDGVRHDLPKKKK